MKFVICNLQEERTFFNFLDVKMSSDTVSCLGEKAVWLTIKSFKPFRFKYNNTP